MSSVRVSSSLTPVFPSAQPQCERSLLQIDPDVFQASFDRRPFTIEHSLVNHPLLTLPSLIELSRRLPESNIRYNRGDIPAGQQIYTAPKTDLSIQETIRQIEQCRSWMVIRFVEQDPIYRDLLDQCLDEIQPLSDSITPGMFKREGFIFITSPGSVTPFHADPEHNFLLQIRGKKTANLFDVSDRTIVSEQALESYLSGEPFKGEFKDEYQQKAFVFDLGPGDGLHFPQNWPHWVKNGDEVSISLSITFRSAKSERTSIIYNVNHNLRQRGFNPTPYGKSPFKDAAKFHAFRAARRAKRLFHRSKEEGLRRY
jgi:cupin-like protein